MFFLLFPWISTNSSLPLLPLATAAHQRVTADVVQLHPFQPHPFRQLQRAPPPTGTASAARHPSGAVQHAGLHAAVPQVMQKAEPLGGAIHGNVATGVATVVELNGKIQEVQEVQGLKNISSGNSWSWLMENLRSKMTQ